ncbi:MAG: peptidoglycan-binding protein [Candidatus Paceibacterota bacterium]
MKKYILGLFLFGFILVPSFSFADPVDPDLITTGSDCVDITHSLSYANRNKKSNDVQDVSALQDFLQTNGYLSTDPTGYFSKATRDAVKKFQAANGLTADGSVGPKTRKVIHDLTFCDGTTPIDTFSILSPKAGESYGPASVVAIRVATGELNKRVILRLYKGNQVAQTITEGYSNSTDGIFSYSWAIPSSLLIGTDYRIHAQLPDNMLASGSSKLSGYFSITTQTPTTPSITVLSPNGGETLQVGKTYNITWTSIGVDKVYIWLAGKDATDVAELITEESPASIGRYSWAIPTNNSDINRGGQFKIKVARKAADSSVVLYDSSDNYFTITSATTPSNQPTISKIEGPQTLNIGQMGTWKVNASAPLGNLSYSVVWGDENLRTTTGLPTQSMQQVATFNHTYGVAGVFTPTFTVKSENMIRCNVAPCLGDNSGTDTSSLTVNVGNSVVPTASCTDSDGGINLDIVGITDDRVNGIGTSYTDKSVGINGSVCSGASCTGVAEGYCENNLVKNLVYQCSSGYSVNGACAKKVVVPSITVLSPKSGPVGTVVTVSGSGFIGSKGVGWFDQPGSGGYLISSAISSDNSMKFTIPSKNPGTYYVAVQTSSGQSNNLPFTITSPTPIPPIVGQTISVVSPSKGQTFMTRSILPINIKIGANRRVAVRLYKGNVSVQNIIEGYPDTTGEVEDYAFTHSWTIPATLVAGSDYRIYAQLPDGVQQAIISDYFSITTPTVSIPQNSNALDAFNSATNENKGNSQTSSCSSFVMNLSKGMNNPEVKCLQQMLLEKGYKIDGITKGEETTYFGYSTLVTLKAFQTDHQLTADGIMGVNTFSALKN